MKPAIPLVQMIAKRLMARQYRFAVNHASGYTHHARPGIPRQIRFGYSRTGPYAQTLDPYGVMDEWELPEEFDQIGREHFARAPGSDESRPGRHRDDRHDRENP